MVSALLALCPIAGCADNAPTARERQDQALRDPFGYGPQVPQRRASGDAAPQRNHEATRKDFDDGLDP